LSLQRRQTNVGKIEPFVDSDIQFQKKKTTVELQCHQAYGAGEKAKFTKLLNFKAY